MKLANLVLLIVALVLFLLAGLNVQARYNLIAWGLFCLALVQLVVATGL